MLLMLLRTGANTSWIRHTRSTLSPGALINHTRDGWLEAQENQVVKRAEINLSRADWNMSSDRSWFQQRHLATDGSHANQLFTCCSFWCCCFQFQSQIDIRTLLDRRRVSNSRLSRVEQTNKLPADGQQRYWLDSQSKPSHRRLLFVSSTSDTEFSLPFIATSAAAVWLVVPVAQLVVACHCSSRSSPPAT